MFGVSFLTPLGALFVVAAAIPLVALAVTERRTARIRRLFAVAGPGRRAVVPVVVALVLLPALVGIAAAQPIVVHKTFLSERADAEAFFVLDTSLSMNARPAPGEPSRLQRAKREALRLRNRLTDVPVGIASMTDRTLPELMPTTDPALFSRTLAASVGIDSPPPSQALHAAARRRSRRSSRSSSRTSSQPRPGTGWSSSSPTASRAGSRRRCATRSATSRG